jgi:hypothetical protein
MATRRTQKLTKTVFSAVTASRTRTPLTRSISAPLFNGTFPHAPENVKNPLSRSKIIDGTTNVASAKFLSHSFTRNFHASTPSYRSAGASQVFPILSHYLLNFSFIINSERFFNYVGNF